MAGSSNSIDVEIKDICYLGEGCVVGSCDSMQNVLVGKYKWVDGQGYSDFCDGFWVDVDDSSTSFNYWIDGGHSSGNSQLEISDYQKYNTSSSNWEEVKNPTKTQKYDFCVDTHSSKGDWRQVSLP